MIKSEHINNCCQKIIGLLNLAPVFPLDGGRIMAVLMDNRLGRTKIVFHTIALAMRIISLAIAFASIYWPRDVITAVIFVAIAIWGPRLLKEELTSSKTTEGPEDAEDLVLQADDKH